MSMEQNKTVVRRIHQEIISQGNLALVDDLVAPDFVHSLIPSGREGFKQALAANRTALPDMQVTVEDVLADGDKAVENWVESGLLGIL